MSNTATDAPPAIPMPSRKKLVVRKIATTLPALTPALAFWYRTLLNPQITPPYEGNSFKEWLARRAERNPKLVGGLLRALKKEVPTYSPAKRASLELPEPLTESLRPKDASQRSIVFLHHAYYHFKCLAEALRRRGWHALSVNLESPTSNNSMYYHGEDLNLWHEDYPVRVARMHDLHEAIARHFKMLHWHGESVSAIFDYNYQTTERDAIPWDFLELKRRGVKLGHSMSGCLTGQRQSLFNKYSNGVCDKCVWQSEPLVCSDPKNHAVSTLLKDMVDIACIEGDYPIDEWRLTRRAFVEPLTYCLDADLWRPDLIPPDDMRLERNPGEILVWHAVGNYDTRAVKGRNIKGTGAVIDAVDQLKAEGHPVRLVFKTGVASKLMRFYQVQADIIVDQLNYGRYGATARECMMLGLPTICYINPIQPRTGLPSPSLTECPLVSADEAGVYDALKKLVEDEALRREIGRKSRAYAMKWHSADACAARFERVYDAMMSGSDLRKIRLDGPNA